MIAMHGVKDTISAKSANSCRVVIVVYEGVNSLDVTGPGNVFARANELVPGSYDVVYAGIETKPVIAECGLQISGLTPIAKIFDPIDTIIVSGGSQDGLFSLSIGGSLVRWLQQRRNTTRRIGSVCTGAFVLAASGLADNRRVVSHWASCEILAKLFPKVSVEPDALFINDGDLFSSAGVAAGIDLALALVEDDLGHDIALRVARSLVLFLRRTGGQSQFSNTLRAQQADAGPFAELLIWIAENLTLDLSNTQLAAQVNMSGRTFARKFRADLGVTPASYVRSVRIEVAKHLLESTSLASKTIAFQVGFGSLDAFEAAIRDAVGRPPLAYRETFGKR
jgi:transcriptional regulator GlxA family with amidase domain